MATAPAGSAPEVAKVDYLIDENASKIEVSDDSGLRVATDIEQQVGGTGPANWWRIGLVALGAIALVILVLQLLGGGASTNVVPGTPTTPPAAASPAPPA